VHNYKDVAPIFLEEERWMQLQIISNIMMVNSQPGCVGCAFDSSKLVFCLRVRYRRRYQQFE